MYEIYIHKISIKFLRGSWIKNKKPFKSIKYSTYNISANTPIEGILRWHQRKWWTHSVNFASQRLLHVTSSKTLITWQWGSHWSIGEPFEEKKETKTLHIFAKILWSWYIFISTQIHSPYFPLPVPKSSEVYIYQNLKPRVNAKTQQGLNIASKCTQIIAKNILLWLSQNLGLKVISSFSASTLSNLEALARKNGLRNVLNAKISN